MKEIENKKEIEKEREKDIKIIESFTNLTILYYLFIKKVCTLSIYPSRKYV